MIHKKITEFKFKMSPQCHRDLILNKERIGSTGYNFSYMHLYLFNIIT